MGNVHPHPFPTGRPIALAVFLLACVAQDPAPAPPRPPTPAPATAQGLPAQDGAGRDGKGKPAPLSIEALDTLLLRAEQNLVRHGLSLDPRQVQLAATDYKAALEGMPEGIDGDRRFTALFGLAFALARMDPPADAAGRDARVRDALESLDRASRIESQPPGSFAGNPGLWIVDGIVREGIGEYAAAERQITLGFAKLEEYRGLRPWQTYQLRIFGLLARGRAFLQAPLNREDLALKDFKAAEALATEALQDPLAPRDRRLRTSILTHKAAAYQSFEYFEEAEKVLAELVATDPDNAVHPYNMGLVQAIQQKYPEALSWYRKSADLNRKDPRPRLKIAFILLRYPDPGKEPDTEAAVREGEIYLSRIGGEPDPEYCALRGEAAFLRREMKESEAWFRRALALNPSCRTALQRLINILGQKEDPTDAAQEEIRDLRKKLQDSLKKDKDGGGMETKKSDMTFC